MKKGFTFPESTPKREETFNQTHTRLCQWVNVILLMNLGSEKERLKLRFYKNLYDKHDTLTISDMERTVEKIITAWNHIQTRNKFLDEFGEELAREVEEQEEAEYWGKNEVV